MPWIRVAFLLTVLAFSSGYRFRCYWFCTDQTGIQNDYVEQRDRCRDFAQLKLDMALRGTPGPIDDKTRKSKLVSLFSECMANNGWNIPAGADPKPPTIPGPPASVGAAAPGTAPASSTPAQDSMAASAEARAALSRTSECAFARQAAANSSIAAARAQACDLECAQRMRAAPDAPRPAACPADIEPGMATGVEREQ